MIIWLAVAAILGVSAFYIWQTIFFIIVYILLLFLYSPSKKRVVYTSLTIALYFLIAHAHAYFQQSHLSSNQTQFLLQLNEIPKIDGNAFQTMASTANNEDVLLRYTITSQEEKQQLLSNYQVGLTCLVKGKLEAPEANRNEHAFDYKQFLQNQRIHWIVRANQSPLSYCQKSERSIWSYIKMLRLNGLQHIESTFPKEAKGFAAALLFGFSDWIEEEDYNAYKTLSLVHILAISGMHVAILSACFFYCGVRAGITREWTSILLLILLPLYGVIAGGTPSVLRACFTVMLVILLSFCKIRISAVQLIGLLFLLLLLLNPFYLQQVGFQLSFFITFVLLMSGNILKGFSSQGWLYQSLAVTVICQLGSLPILLYFFYELSLWGFLVNLFYIPLYTFVLLPLTFVCFFISLLFPFLVMWPFKILEWCFSLSNKLAVFLADLPYASLSFSKPSLPFITFLCIALLCLFYYWEQKNRKRMIQCIVLLLCCLVVLYHKVYLSPVGEITFIDVGQGDSIFIKRPFGQGVYLIDTGGIMSFSQERWQKRTKPFETGKNIVVPFLKSKGVHQIDKLILTHDDQDHIGGVNAVLKAMKVKEIVIPRPLTKEFSKTSMWMEMMREKSKMTLLEDGDGWKKGNDFFQILHPASYLESSNESSLVLFLKMNKVKWLLTGDLGGVGEAELLHRYPQLQTDILKLGHHGSKHSSSPLFLDAIKPKVAIVSAGKNNRYHHPSVEVVEDLRKRGITLLRTDQQGAVSYKYLWGISTFSVTLP